MAKLPENDDDLRAAAMEAERDAMREHEGRAPLPRTNELDIAWRLFEHIRERDPASVDSRDTSLETFKGCLDTVRHSRSGWASLQQNSTPDLDDDVPF